MAEGEPPFSQIGPNRAMMLITSRPATGLSIPNQHSAEFNNFVKRCLIIDAKQRPTAKELLLDPFITKMAKNKHVISELVATA